jgi:Crp-like helix-turn-helix domain
MLQGWWEKLSAVPLPRASIEEKPAALQTYARSGHNGRLTLPFEKRLLASILGMTPENLSRGFATLAAHGLKTEGQVIVISDRQKLQHLARENPLIEEIASVKRRRLERPGLREPALILRPDR